MDSAGSTSVSVRIWEQVSRSSGPMERHWPERTQGTSIAVGWTGRNSARSRPDSGTRMLTRLMHLAGYSASTMTLIVARLAA